VVAELFCLLQIPLSDHFFGEVRLLIEIRAGEIEDVRRLDDRQFNRHSSSSKRSILGTRQFKMLVTPSSASRR
jgi:hypothetical protein